MSKSGFVHLFIILTLFLGWSCHSSRSAGQAAQEEKLANSLLWEISSPELAEPSYLFGTIHIIPGHLYFWPDHFQQAYEASDQVILEIDELGTDPASMMGLMPRMMLPDDVSLEDLVSEEEYGVIESYFGEMGLPMLFLNKIKPFFPYMLVDIDFEKLMSADTKSYELELTQRSNQDQKPVLGLETIDYQMSIFDSIPYTDQAQLLVRAIEDKGNNVDSSSLGKDHIMFQTYVDQDLNSLLEQVMEEEDGPMMKYNNLFLHNRNRNWIPRIEEYIRDKSSFIAVGAAHLPGETGVIRLLQQKGYSVKPIMDPSHGID